MPLNITSCYLKINEENILFNDALNTFYVRLYGVRHMIKDHSNSKRGNLLPPHRLLFLISSKVSFICIISQTDNTYHGLCYTSRGALAGTRNSSMGCRKDGARCSSMVEHPLMVQWVIGSIPHEPFLVI